MSEQLSDNDPDVQRVREAAKALGEFYDAVQIFASRNEEGERSGTININLGVGNWFARYGHVVDWIVKTDEFTRIKARQQEKSEE